jgi:hypothetical protein
MVNMRLLLIALFLAPVALFGLFYGLSESHQVVPGLNGCRFVRDRTSQIDCYTGQFRKLVKEDGLTKAFTTVDRNAQHSTTLGADCHLAWHPLGEEAGRKDARAKRTFVYRRQPTTCRKGFAHGYTIGYLDVGGKTGSKVDIAAQMTKACASDPDVDTVLNCTHSFGHVIARQNQQSVARATKQCDQADYSIIPDRQDRSVPVTSIGTGARFQCMYGMYMEYGLLDLSNPDAHLNNCRGVHNKVAREACYSYLPARVGAFKGSLEAAAKSCHDMAPKGRMREACVSYFSFGLDSSERCELFPVESEQESCRNVVAGRTGGLG